MLLFAIVATFYTSEAFVTTTRVAVHNRLMFPLNDANNLLQDVRTIDKDELKIKDIAVPSSIQTIQQEVSKVDEKNIEIISSTQISQKHTKAIDEKDEVIPSTWPHALHRFFLGDVGPPLVVLSISGFIYTRCQLQYLYRSRNLQYFSP